MKKYPKQVKDFGARIKYLRKKNNLTQEELATQTGITRRTVQRIEAGDFGIGINVVFALAVVLKVEPSKLFDSVALRSIKKD